MKKTKAKNHTTRELHRAFYRGNHLNFALALGLFILMSVTDLFFAWLLSELINVVDARDTGRLKEILFMALAFIPLNFGILTGAQRFKSRFVHRGIRQYKD